MISCCYFCHSLDMSTTTQTFLALPQISPPEKGYLNVSSASISSEASFVTLNKDDASFIPGKTLHIGAVGIGLFRLPLPSKELEIPIYNSDGTVAYLSTREKRCSSNAVLSHPIAGSLLSTSYFFGPGRDPILTTLTGSGEVAEDSNSQMSEKRSTSGQIKVGGKWMSRAQTFQLPNGQTFMWHYVSESSNEDGGKKKQRLLVLREKDSGRKIAYLARTEETRAPGSSSSSAGNGGELVFAMGSELDLDEALIVATCVMMLKKEIDRRRMVQMAVLVSAVSA